MCMYVGFTILNPPNTIDKSLQYSYVYKINVEIFRLVLNSKYFTCHIRDWIKTSSRITSRWFQSQCSENTLILASQVIRGKDYWTTFKNDTFWPIIKKCLYNAVEFCALRRQTLQHQTQAILLFLCITVFWPISNIPCFFNSINFFNLKRQSLLLHYVSIHYLVFLNSKISILYHEMDIGKSDFLR